MDHFVVAISLVQFCAQWFCGPLSLVLLSLVLPEVGASQHFPGDCTTKLEVNDPFLVETLEALVLLAKLSGRVEVAEERLITWFSSLEWTVYGDFGKLALKKPAWSVGIVMHEERGLESVKALSNA